MKLAGLPKKIPEKDFLKSRPGEGKRIKQVGKQNCNRAATELCPYIRTDTSLALCNTCVLGAGLLSYHKHDLK